jgi:hypothetical protein
VDPRQRHFATAASTSTGSSSAGNVYEIRVNPERTYLGKATQEWLYLRQCAHIRERHEVLKGERGFALRDEEDADCRAVQELMKKSGGSPRIPSSRSRATWNACSRTPTAGARCCPARSGVLSCLSSSFRKHMAAITPTDPVGSKAMETVVQRRKALALVRRSEGQRRPGVEISRNSQTTFVALILTCVYSYLAIATTTDAALISN